MNSILVVGLGRFGRHLAVRCQEEGCEVMAVEISQERADLCVNDIPNIEIADMREPEVVKSMGIDNFDVCVVAAGSDFQTALEITVLLKDHGARQIVARATRDVHKKLLLRNGADHVVFSEKDMAERIAMQISSNKVFDYFKLDDEIGVYEIAMPEKWHGKNIIELSVRQKYNVSVLAVKRGDRLYPIVDPTYVLQMEDRLLIMGDDDQVRRLTR